MPKGRSASQAGRRGTALVSVAVGSRGRVFLVARLCLRFSARVALRGFPVPSSPWPPGSLPALCPFSPPAACRSSLPRAAHRLLRCWPPRLGPNPAPPSGGVAAGHAGWPGVRVPMARAFGTGSAAPRVGPGGRPEGLGRPFRRVAGESGFRGLWPRATGCGGGGAAGIAEGLVGRSRCHVGPSSCSEAAGGEIPACVLVAVGCARGVPRRPPPRSAACLARRLVFSRPALPHRVGARPRPGCASLPRPAAALPRGVCLGRCRRRGGGPSSPRVALPRSARACARVRPGGPSRAGVRATCVKVDLSPAGCSPFPPLGRGWGPARGPRPRSRSPVSGGAGAPAGFGRLRFGRRVACATPAPAPAGGARSRASAGPRASTGGVRGRCGRTGATVPRAGHRGPPLARCPNVGAAPRGGGGLSPRRAARPRARVCGRRLPRGCRARIGRSASSHAGRARGVGGRVRVGGRVARARVSGWGSARCAPPSRRATPRPPVPSPPARARSALCLPARPAAAPSLAGRRAHPREVPPASVGGPRRALPTWLILPVAYACLKD